MAKARRSTDKSEARLRRRKGSSNGAPAPNPHPSPAFTAAEPVAFWERPRARLIGLLLLIGLTFLLTLPWSIFPGSWLQFPLGWAGWWPGYHYNVWFWDKPEALMVVWLLYLGMAAAFLSSKRYRVVRILYFTLAILVLLNAVGCQLLVSAGHG